MSYERRSVTLGRTIEWNDQPGFSPGAARRYVWQIELPHSCDEWAVGGPEEARVLIEDLEAAIVEWGAKSREPGPWIAADQPMPDEP